MREISYQHVSEKKSINLTLKTLLFKHIRGIHRRNIQEISQFDKRFKHLSQTPPFHCQSTFEMLLGNAGPNVVRQPVVEDVSPFSFGDVWGVKGGKLYMEGFVFDFGAFWAQFLFG